MLPYYRRRPPRRNLSDYFKPILIIVILFGLIYYGFSAFTSNRNGAAEDALGERVFLNIENGSAKAMTVSDSKWGSAPDRIYLYRGERLKTSADSRVTLTYNNKIMNRLDNDTEVRFASMKDDNVALELASGSLWAKTDSVSNPKATFTVNTKDLTIDAGAGSILAIDAPDTVTVVKGSAQVGVKSNDDVVKTFPLGIGQQLTVDEKSLDAIKNQRPADVIFAMNDAFRVSDWTVWNMKKDGAITAYEESGATATDTGAAPAGQDNATSPDAAVPTATDAPLMGKAVSVSSPSDSAVTNKPTFVVTGRYDSTKVSAVTVQGKRAALNADGSWNVTVPLNKEGINSIAVVAEDSAGVKTTLTPFEVTYDTTPPSSPKITAPGSNDDKVMADDVVQLIKGTVSEDTEVIMVDDYKLAKYVPGSKSFEYYAKVAYDNLKVGDNLIQIYAEDKAGNVSEPAKITITLTQAVIDESKAGKTVTTDATATTAASTSTGGVKFTGPHNGDNFETTDTAFDLTGTVPSTTAKVQVNNYTLGLYQPGSTGFKYKASAALGNVTPGQKNTFTANAYDADGKLIGSASLIIDVKSADTASGTGTPTAPVNAPAPAGPVISIPTADPTYTTNLDELVIGGSVGADIDKVFMNGTEVSDYSVGNGQWTYTAKLTGGDNVFTVTGEKAGQKTAAHTITITYKP